MLTGLVDIQRFPPVEHCVRLPGEQRESMEIAHGPKSVAVLAPQLARTKILRTPLSSHGDGGRQNEVRARPMRSRRWKLLQRLSFLNSLRKVGNDSLWV